MFVLISFQNCGNTVGSFEAWFIFGCCFREGMFIRSKLRWFAAKKSLTKQRKLTEKKLSFGILNTNKKTNTLTGEKPNPVCYYVNYRNSITYNGPKPWSLILAGNYPARDLFGEIIYLWLFTALIWISLRLWSFLSCTLRNRSTLIW